MKEYYDKDLPDSIRQGQRLTTMTSGQARFPIAPSVFKFHQHGQSGAWISEILPYTAKMADEIAIVRSLHTEAINHEPAITFIQTGSMIAGKPGMGAWVAYGLGSMNRDLPTFVVLNATHSHPKANVQAISAKLWSSGFLSARYSGVALRAGRAHHPRCFSLWAAGGGVKPGIVHGETDDFSYNSVRDPVHMRDFQATILHLFGIDHERFTYKYQGLDQRLTGVEKATVVKSILA
jgi:hypothetical protein